MLAAGDWREKRDLIPWTQDRRGIGKLLVYSAAHGFAVPERIGVTVIQGSEIFNQVRHRSDGHRRDDGFFGHANTLAKPGKIQN
jgi:hypothetical protein